MINDRFKFRVWDEASGVYCNANRFAIADCGVLLSIGNHGTALSLQNPQGLVFEQCTGLKDANGKLIYEGDIICGKNPEVCHEIVFDHERACFRAELLPKTEHWMQNSAYCTLSQQWINEFSKRVVGTIHENPELLEGKQ